jgi:predicted DCC family thiol-disulfide oxidoreductase YuxK
VTGDLTVLYDGDCGVCTHTARALVRLDSQHRLRLVALQRADVPGMPPRDQLLDSLHVIDASGRWSVGAAAWVELASRIPVLWPSSVAARRLPLAMPILDVIFRLVAENRHHISRLLGLRACQVRTR